MDRLRRYTPNSFFCLIWRYAAHRARQLVGSPITMTKMYKVGGKRLSSLESTWQLSSLMLPILPSLLKMPRSRNLLQGGNPSPGSHQRPRANNRDQKKQPVQDIPLTIGNFSSAADSLSLSLSPRSVTLLFSCSQITGCLCWSPGLCAAQVIPSLQVLHQIRRSITPLARRDCRCKFQPCPSVQCPVFPNAQWSHRPRQPAVFLHTNCSTWNKIAASFKFQTCLFAKSIFVF